jgi:hypothetical protein
MGQHRNRVFLASIVSLGIVLLWARVGQNQALVTIGNGAKFAILGDGPLPNDDKNLLSIGDNAALTGTAASIGGVGEDIDIGAFSTIQGDVATSIFTFNPPAANIHLGPKAIVKGKCVTAPSGSVNAASQCRGGVDSTGTNPYVTFTPLGLIGTAANQEECVDANVLCQTITQQVQINPTPSAKTTLTTTVFGGLNVLQAPNIILGSLATLTLRGGPNDEVILETPGTINLGPSSKILLAGGLQAKNVLITATTPGRGEDPGVNPGSTSWINTGSGVTISGEVHAENGCTYGPNNTINGAIVCDWGLQAGTGLHINHIPMSLAMPQCTDSGPSRCSG